MNKTLKLSLSILLLFIAYSVHSQNFKNASEYLDFVGEEQQLISKSMWKYTKAVAHSKSDRNINNKRKTLIKTMEKSISKIKRAKGFDGDEYKNQVLEYMQLNESLLKNDYAKIVDMKAIAEQSYDAMEAYMLTREAADKKMEEAQQMYETNFYAYATKHNINIIESDTDLGKKMKISGEVFSHYNKLYLIYFKVYINEVYLIDALNKSDISALEQATNALSESAKEGLEILKTEKAYKTDKSIILATKSAFEFFIDEADVKFPKIIEFLVLNEDFETIKNTLEKTPERKRTKKQIDTYNKKVKEVNKAVKVYNKTNTELNNKRQSINNKLNATNDKFLGKHIPKD